MPVWDADAEGGSLICYATALAPGDLFLIECREHVYSFLIVLVEPYNLFDVY